MKNVIFDAYNKIKSLEIELPPWVGAYYEQHKSRLLQDFEIIEEHVDKDSDLVEVGGAPFLLSVALGDAGYKLDCFDIDPERFENISNACDISIVKFDIENDDTDNFNDKYDVVIMNEVFEHLRVNLNSTMKKILILGKSDSLLIMSTPNLKSLKGIYNYVFKGKAYSCASDIYDEYEKIIKIGHMGHVREYTVCEVESYLKKVGYKNIKKIYRGKYNNVIAMIVIKVFPALSPFVTYVATK